MDIDANRLANQVKLAYEFMEAFHGQALALIKDVETQLAQTPEDLRCLRPGGSYRFAVNSLSTGLERPQANIANYYAVFFRHFEESVKNTPLDQNVPPIVFLKVVLRELRLKHPEVRFGVITKVTKSTGRADGQWPKTFEQIISHVADRALIGPLKSDQEKDYRSSYINLAIHGTGVRLADLPDSEAVAEKIIDHLLTMYREVVKQS